MSIKKALVLQHVAVEHPGVLRDFLRGDGIVWDTVELDEGGRIPALDGYDMMIVMGGPQDVWQEEQYPWLIDEKAAIRRFVVELGRPFLGICLGHQLLAEAIGGRVALGAQAEVGIMPVTLTAAGRAHPLFRGLGDPLTVLQWHSAEVVSLPEGCEVLAASPACAVQAFRFGQHAFGLQCHVEITASTVAEWAAIAAYAAALEQQLGANAVERLRQAVDRQLPQFQRDARALYDNLMAHLGRHGRARTTAHV